MVPPPPPPPHALVVPSSGLGHINASVLLARSLSSLGFSVSFVYLSLDFRLLSHHNRLPHPSDHFSVHVLHDAKIHPVSDPLTPFLATPDMLHNLRNLIRKLHADGHPVTCLVSDSFSPWTQDVADEERIPRIEYWTSNAIAHYMICNAGPLIDRGVFPEQGSPTHGRSREAPPLMIELPGMAPFPSTRYPRELRFAKKENPFLGFLREVAEASKRSERILMHTMRELEEEVFGAYEAVGSKAYAIGPLLHHAAAAAKEGGRSKRGGEEEKEECMAWLEGQKAGSVLYVAFGSHAKLEKEDVEELAKGLEASGVPFLWALRRECRPPPPGFGRTSLNGGLLVEWAPQIDVLSHPSVAGFLSHCGWNSSLESICAGVPLLCCPLVAEQHANAEFISDVWKIGIDLQRTPEGRLHHHLVQSAVKCLMHDDVGRYVRQRVTDLMHLSRRTTQEGGPSMANLRRFYDDMKARAAAAGG